MSISENCGACGTPKSKNRFKESDCPHCRPENFVGFSVAEKEKMPVIEKAVVSDEIRTEKDEII